MVGIAVGMITVLIISQTFITFESSKQTTTTGTNAQENGLMALYLMEQDARNAGVGFAEGGIFDCATIYTYYDPGGGGTPGPIPDFGTTPVVITDGGANGSDTVTFRTATDFLGIIPAYLRDTMPQPSAELDINRTYGFYDGQLIIVQQGANCTLMQVTQVQSASLKVQHNPGVSAPYNPPAAYQNDNGWPAYTTGAKILGVNQMIVRVYSVNANLNLQVVERLTIGGAPTTRELVRNVVSVQAQYGVSAAVGNETVSSWVDATGTWSALDTPDEVKRVKAVRIVVVARSEKRETTAVTTDAQLPDEVEASVHTVPDWQFYRYKVYTTIVPLRNVLWANV
jgi:type IV pilus assembly protein PilW